MYSPSSPPIEMGAPAGSPRKPVRPESACRVNSVAARPDHGPVQPKSVTVTTMQSGLAATSSYRVKPAAPATGGDDDIGACQQVIGK